MSSTFPWDIDRTFWDVLCVDHLRLLRNAVEWAANEAPPSRSTDPACSTSRSWRAARLDDGAPRQPDEPDDDEGAAARMIPVGPERVRLRLPEGVRPTRVQLLTAGLTPPVDVSDGVLTVTVPSIEVHEVIAIDV